MIYTNLQIRKAIRNWKRILENMSGNRVILESKMTRSELDDFYQRLQLGEVKFKFIKKDGSERIARGTLSPSLMPSELQIRQLYGADYDNMMQMFQTRREYMVYFWDLDNSGYRQFHVSRFEGYMSNYELMTCSQLSRALTSGGSSNAIGGSINPQYNTVFIDAENGNDVLTKIQSIDVDDQARQVKITLKH